MATSVGAGPIAQPSCTCPRLVAVTERDISILIPKRTVHTTEEMEGSAIVRAVEEEAGQTQALVFQWIQNQLLIYQQIPVNCSATEEVAAEAVEAMVVTPAVVVVEQVGAMPAPMLLTQVIPLAFNSSKMPGVFESTHL